MNFPVLIVSIYIITFRFLKDTNPPAPFFFLFFPLSRSHFCDLKFMQLCEDLAMRDQAGFTPLQGSAHCRVMSILSHSLLLFSCCAKVFVLYSIVFAGVRCKQYILYKTVCTVSYCVGFFLSFLSLIFPLLLLFFPFRIVYLVRAIVRRWGRRFPVCVWNKASGLGI